MTSSQWLDLAVLAIAFVAAISGWRSGALGSLLSFVGVVLGAVAGVLLAPHVVEPHRRAAHQAVRRAVPDPRAGGDRRDRGRGAWPRGARRHPQPGAAHLRLGDRRRRCSWSRCWSRRGCWPPRSRRRISPIWLRRCAVRACCDQVDERGAALAEAGADAVVVAAGHLRSARCAATVRPHADRQRRRPGRRAGHRPGGRGHPAQRAEDPRRRAELPEGARGQRFRRRAQPGDVQRARGRRLGDASPSRSTGRPTTPAWCPTTPTPTSRSSTCPTCRRRRCSSTCRRRATGTDAVVMGYPGRRRLHRHPGAHPRDHPAQRARHLPHHHGHPRGLHHQRHCPARQFGWSADRPRRQGARRRVRCRGRRRRHRVRADRQRGGQADGQGGQHPAGADRHLHLLSSAAVHLGQEPGQLLVDCARRPPRVRNALRRRWIRTGRAARSAGCGTPGRPARTGRRRRACAAPGPPAAASSTA